VLQRNAEAKCYDHESNASANEGCAARSSVLYFDETNAKREPNTIDERPVHDKAGRSEDAPCSLLAGYWWRGGCSS
jgi:hypothetical protein